MIRFSRDLFITKTKGAWPPVIGEPSFILINEHFPSRIAGGVAGWLCLALVGEVRCK